jgi:primosomal protein N' (replication factor Y)
MRTKGLLEVREEAVAPPRAAGTGTGGGASQLGLEFPEADSGAGPLGAVERSLDARRFGAFLLLGPDADRRPAYRTLIERATRGPGKVLFLLPEIALTRELAGSFEREFGRPAAVFHGRMTEKQKEEAWRSLRSGKSAVIAGTRSALFVEAAPLRLIVVDGEHEDSYFQSESPSYDARRGAWLRARAAGAVVVFGSSRPTVEAREEARGLGALIELGGEAGRRGVAWVEERRDGPLVSRGLETRLRANLDKGEPAVLFLNRRGYASSPVCASCGLGPRCPRCDIPLVYHKTGDKLVCHYCNYSTDVRSACAGCGGRLAFPRPAGTQALEEELGRLFPGVGVARFDADTASKSGDREKILEAFRRGKVPFLVGTQLLVHQPGVPRAGLVGILRPEALLGLPDYRASQRTFQAVAAMTDICRDDPEAEVVIQTAAPVHYSIRAAAEGDYRGFFEKETASRRLLDYPPSAALAEIFLEGRDVRTLAAGSRKLAALLGKQGPGLEVLGPAMAPRARDSARVQFVLKAGSRATIDRALRQSLPAVRQRKSVVFSYSPFRRE